MCPEIAAFPQEKQLKFLASLVLVVLTSVGLAACGQTSTESFGATTANAPKPPNRVVYYMHRTFRCFSCLWIENTTRQTLKETFPSELASGRLDFQVEDYMKREDLAKRYDVQWVSVVVVSVADGRGASPDFGEGVGPEDEERRVSCIYHTGGSCPLGKDKVIGWTDNGLSGIVGAADRRAS